jgi:hypothetical protein
MKIWSSHISAQTIQTRKNSSKKKSLSQTIHRKQLGAFISVKQNVEHFTAEQVPSKDFTGNNSAKGNSSQ